MRYNGLGFPIDLKGVKTRKFRGEILPDINHRELEDLVFKTLIFFQDRRQKLVQNLLCEFFVSSHCDQIAE